MTRTVSAGLKANLFAQQVEAVLLLFAEVSHPGLLSPIRAVADVVDYIWDDNTYVGIPFSVELLTDSERAPRGRLRMQNVDRRIGETVLSLTEAPRLTLSVLSSLDFDLTVDPRVPLSTIDPVVEYQARHLRLRSISGDAIALEADIVSFDLSGNPWPKIRSTQDRLPGLFR